MYFSTLFGFVALKSLLKALLHSYQHKSPSVQWVAVFSQKALINPLLATGLAQKNRQIKLATIAGEHSGAFNTSQEVVGILETKYWT